MLILKILLVSYFIFCMLCVIVIMFQIDGLLNDLVNACPNDLKRGFIKDLKLSLMCMILCFIPVVNIFFCLIITFDKEGLKDAMLDKIEEENKKNK